MKKDVDMTCHFYDFIEKGATERVFGKQPNLPHYPSDSFFHRIYSKIPRELKAILI